MANTIVKKKPRGKGRPFKKGEIANPGGRPLGAKNKLSEDFVAALAADFERYGLYPIVRTRNKDPGGYLRVIASIIPKEIQANVNHNHKHTHEPVSETVDWITGLLRESEKGKAKKLSTH